MLARARIGKRVRTWGRGLSPAIALLGAMAFITQVGVSIMLPLLPLYATSLGATPTVLGLLTSGFAVTIAVGQLGGGYLVERLAPRRLVSIGIGTYAAANVLIGTATASSVTRPLVLLFLVQAFFQASFGAFITTYAVFTQERLGWATAEVGLVFSAFGLGSILLGPVLANLADRRGRRDVAILGA